jgi:hypothetical protein
MGATPSVPSLPTQGVTLGTMPRIISGPLFYIVVKGQIIGRTTGFDETHNYQLATAPEVGNILYTEQDIMLYSGTVTLTKFALFGEKLSTLGVQFGANAVNIAYTEFSIFDKTNPGVYLRTYYDCLPQTLQGTWNANQYVTETATFQFLSATTNDGSTLVPNLNTRTGATP